MSEALPLDGLCFKGARTYLQGPDLYDACTAALASRLGAPLPGPCQFSIARKARSQVTALVAFDGVPPAKPNAPIGSFMFGQHGAAAIGWLIANEQPVVGRRDFSEDEIWKVGAVNGNIAQLDESLPFTPAELVVSMTKKLHHALMPPPAGRHWAVTRFVLKRPFEAEDTAPIMVTYETSLGVTLTRCAVTVADGPIGQIFFSLTEP